MRYESVKRTARDDGTHVEVLTSPIISPASTYAIGKGGPINGWQKKLKDNVSCQTPLTVDSIEYNQQGTSSLLRINQPPSAGFRYVEQKSTVYFTLSSEEKDLVEDPTLLSDLVSRTETMFKSKVASSQRELDAGVFIAELGQTRAMLGKRAGQLLTGFMSYADKANRIKRLWQSRSPENRRKSIDMFNKQLANDWLEFMFGAIPLAHDIVGGFEAIDALLNEQPPIRVIKMQGQTSSLGWPSFRTVNKWNVNYNRLGLKSQKVSVKYKGAIEAERSLSTDRSILSNYITISKRFGTDMDSFLPTVWEVAPWSFLVDYFTNVGDVLNAYGFHKKTLVWYWRGTKSVSENIIETRGVSSSHASGELLSGGSSRDMVIKTAKTRSVPEFEQFPVYCFEIPGMRSLKWANIGALIIAKSR